MKLSKLETLTRRGPILTGGRHDLQLAINLARSVVRKNDLEWRAESPQSAAAWLMLLTHQNACLDDTLRILESMVPAKNTLLLFRGQAAKYSSVLSSIYRPGKDRDFESRAKDWLHVVIQLWLEESFKWAIRPHGKLPLDTKDTTTIAQHYGIATLLTDWTWDPLNALAFAIQGQRTGSEGTILINTISKETNDEVLLPPTFAYRVWKQRGAFQWFYTPPEDFDDAGVQQLGLSPFLNARTLVSNYPRITFPIDEEGVEWASSRYMTLMTDDGPLAELTNWAMETSRQATSRSPGVLSYNVRRDNFEELLNQLGLQLPRPLDTAATNVVHENIAMTVEYCDMMALRKRGDRLGYDLGALVVFSEALGDGNSVCRDLEERDTTPNLKIICRVAKEPHRERALIDLANPLLDFKSNVRAWYEDDWNGIDLFTPFEPALET